MLRSNKSKGRKNKKIVRKELAPTAARYDGPVRSPEMFQQHDTYTTVLTSDGIISSDVGGVLAPVFTSNPNAPGGGFGPATGWASLAAVFDEYRVLAFEVEFLSVYDQLISGASNMLTSVIDYDSTAALVSYAQSDNYASQKNFSIQEYDGKLKKRIVLMNGIENSVFITTTGPAALMWLKMFASGLVVSTQVLHVFVRYRVQYRGRGI